MLCVSIPCPLCPVCDGSVFFLWPFLWYPAFPPAQTKASVCLASSPQGLLAPSSLPEAILLLAAWLQPLWRPHAKQLAGASRGKKGCPEPKRERQTPWGGGWRKASGSWLCSVTLAKAFPRSFCFPSPLSQWQPVRLCISAPHCQALLPPRSPRLWQGCLAFAVPSSALGPPLPFLERRG